MSGKLWYLVHLCYFVVIVKNVINDGWCVKASLIDQERGGM